MVSEAAFVLDNRPLVAAHELVTLTGLAKGIRSTRQDMLQFRWSTKQAGIGCSGGKKFSVP